jgi:phage-related tail fiber protein
MPNGIPTVDNAIDTGILTDRIANLELYISQTLVPALNSGQVPTGSIMPWAANGNLPTGFLLCNGASVSRTTYSDLFNVIGTAFGTASGTTFNLPDFQGRFLRGRDNSAGRDPDAASRTAQNTGGATGDNVGSVQGYGVQDHTHVTSVEGGGGGTNALYENAGWPWGTISSILSTVTNANIVNRDGFGGSVSGMSTTGIVNDNPSSIPDLPTPKTNVDETRPVNSAVNFIIKYTANVSL